jgi:hypothetical protein
MRNYYIEKIGRGIEGGYSDDLLKIAGDFDAIVDSRKREGWEIIHRDLRLGVDWSSVVLVKKDRDLNVHIEGYQIKSVEV